MGRVTATNLLTRLLQRPAAASASAAAKPKATPPIPKRLLPASTHLDSILSYVSAGNLHGAISFLSHSSCPPLPTHTYSSLLYLCSSTAASLSETRLVVSSLLSQHSSPPTFLLNRAIEAYGKCRSLDDARLLFDGIANKDGGTWNAMIVAYSQKGNPEEALKLFFRMNLVGVRLNEITLATVLCSCADLLELLLVKQIHGLVVKFGYRLNVILMSSLVDTYGKCQALEEARRVFDEMPNPNSVTWNVIVRRYLEVGRHEDAVFMFYEMIRKGARPLSFTVSNVLVACADLLSLTTGCVVHGFSVKIGLEGNNVVGNSFIEMYARCGATKDARHFFDRHDLKDVISWTSIISLYVSNGKIDEAEKLFLEMPVRNIVSWNAILSGYVRSCCWEKALDLIFWMQKEIWEINHVTLCLILNVCAALFDLEKGKQVHGFAYRRGFFSYDVVDNAVLDVYGKCGSLRAAETWFFQMGAARRDRVSWNTLIRSFASHKRSELALSAFHEMWREATPNEFTLSVVLSACANIFALNCGKQIHAFVITTGLGNDEVLSSTLVDMYSKCRYLDYAAKVFEGEDSQDIILWNSMILGCAHNGYGEDALALFEALEKKGIKSNNTTFYGILLACISEGFVDLGRQYFNSMSEKYSIIPLVEHYHCMVDLLGRYGRIDELENFVRAMPFDPTVAMWTRIFDYCREHGHSSLGEKAATCINEADPSNPVRFEAISPPTELA